MNDNSQFISLTDNEDDLSVPSDDDPLPTPPIDDEATEPDSLNWDEENIYNTQASKLNDKPLCKELKTCT